MTKRTKILIVDSDLHTLSRIYLALVHRNYKAEASNKWEEVPERIKRLKPEIIILGKKEYLSLKQSLRIPGIVLLNEGDLVSLKVEEGFVVLKNPVHVDELIRAIEALII
jgi:DNA-binding response OmpR family regulator